MLYMLGNAQLKSVTVYASQPMQFDIGGKIVRNEKETTITVKKITVWGKNVKIKLSDGEVLEYKGFPISVIWKN